MINLLETTRLITLCIICKERLKEAALINLRTLLGGACGLTNLPFDIGRISGEAMPSDENDEFTWNKPTYHAVLNMQNSDLKKSL